jgi:DNA (cytosine-5)-methyltransferase 1
MEKTVVELFAGVGGFRVGLNNVSIDSSGNVIEQKNFNFVWANQWEPSTKTQHAFDCYVKRFGESDTHVNEDISKVDKVSIPDHTLLVGGFPCQDYSVARSLSKEKGIEGKKGVLWWEIYKTVEAKKPPFILLENVDRLLKSPSKQRGRDFGIMLRSLNDLGYGVEWRVINAAEYGFAQRRRRVFIFGFKSSTDYYKKYIGNSNLEILSTKGFFASSLPVEIINKTSNMSISKKDFADLVSISEKFAFGFENAGYCINHEIVTTKVKPIIETPITLNDIVHNEAVDESLFLNDEQLKKFKYLRDSKKIERTNKETLIKYFYSEGSMSFPDSLDLPGRTMLTSEGSINRSTHVIYDKLTGKTRLLSPIETERLNGFPDNWTNTGMPDSRRYFMMGNALVCGVVNRLGKNIANIISTEQ